VRATRPNKAKHGLNFIEAEALWNGDRIRISAKTVEGEARYAMIGKIGGRLHTVIITYRGDAVRIISARASSKNEIAIYEANKKS
jgi:uncharacterized DUF497 family protein